MQAEHWTWAHLVLGAVLFWWGHRLGRREGRRSRLYLMEELDRANRLNGFLAARGPEIDKRVMQD